MPCQAFDSFIRAGPNFQQAEPLKSTYVKAKGLDRIFDHGEVDITAYLDLSRAFHPGHEQKRVNVDFPTWMIDQLDRKSSRVGPPASP